MHSSSLMKHHHRLLSYGILAFLFALFLFSAIYFFQDLKDFFTPSAVRELLLNTGWWGYLVLVLLVAASVPLPIPSVVVVLAGGYVYGIWVGGLLSLTGIVIGSSFSFYLTRFLGKPFLELMVDEHHIAHFNHIFQRRGITAALISYAVPVFPSDGLSMLLGLTKVHFRLFFAVALFGHIPRILLTSVLGNDLLEGFSARTVMVLVLCTLFVLIAIFRERVKKLFFKELHELEREGKKVEKGVEKEAKVVGKEARVVEKGVVKEVKKMERGLEKEAKVVEHAVEDEVEKVEEEVEEEIKNVGKKKKRKR